MSSYQVLQQLIHQTPAVWPRFSVIHTSDLNLLRPPHLQPSDSAALRPWLLIPAVTAPLIPPAKLEESEPWLMALVLRLSEGLFVW